jgi:hypothetical protein
MVIGKCGSGITFLAKHWEKESLGKSNWDGEDLNRVRLLEKVYRYFPNEFCHFGGVTDVDCVGRYKVNPKGKCRYKDSDEQN